MHMEERWQEIRNQWSTYPSLYAVVGFILGLMFFPAMYYLFTDPLELLKDFVPEVMGITFVVFVVDRAYRDLEKRQRIQQLIDTVRAGVHGSAENALHELMKLNKLDLLRNISLNRIDLSNAKLRNFDFSDMWITNMNFREAHLSYIEFTGSNLEFGDFSNAVLDSNKFTKARLSSASFRNSSVNYCNFVGAQLGNADFRDADLWKCNLQNAELLTIYHIMDRKSHTSIEHVLPAKFSDKTILPNGEKWNPETMGLEYLRDTYGCIIDKEQIKQNMDKRAEAGSW